MRFKPPLSLQIFSNRTSTKQKKLARYISLLTRASLDLSSHSPLPKRCPPSAPPCSSLQVSHSVSVQALSFQGKPHSLTSLSPLLLLKAADPISRRARPWSQPPLALLGPFRVASPVCGLVRVKLGRVTYKQYRPYTRHHQACSIHGRIRPSTPTPRMDCRTYHCHFPRKGSSSPSQGYPCPP